MVMNPKVKSVKKITHKNTSKSINTISRKHDEQNPAQQKYMTLPETNSSHLTIDGWKTQPFFLQRFLSRGRADTSQKCTPPKTTRDNEKPNHFQKKYLSKKNGDF